MNDTKVATCLKCEQQQQEVKEIELISGTKEGIVCLSGEKSECNGLMEAMDKQEMTFAKKNYFDS